ncbi:MAG: aminopeptidase N C-terminal domain-containing protein, partial [Alphaproteobacteria bacterium]|nr:aminopeptidase N C-terminal domain-containing protein [Alphaproteobacteria bacterium]
EQYYGRCFDHDRCSIVAVNDFNAGAMENKGLNVFNAPYVLISSETATDRDLQNVESVIAHEYFHNWTGNRITLRDWLQLSLKEGLTVYREQHYMQTMHNAETSRLGEAQLMRAHQFPEDASPLAHPVRPTQFARIDNLYTVTVYEKGAEVIRMLSLILGKEGFGKGMDTYFARYDGKAVTCEDFLDAHASANSRDLMQFARWYRQVGTPRVLASVQVMPQGEQAGDKAEEDDELRVVLTLRQLPPTLTTTHPATPESLVIPQLLAFYDKDSGTKWEVTEASCAPTKNANFQPHQRMIGSREEWLFVLHDWQQSWHIRLRGGGGAKHQPLASSGREPTRASIPKVVVSLNRWFSAPIHATQVAALEPLPTAKTPVPPQDAQLGVDDCDVHLPLFRLQYDDDPIILVVARDAVVQAYARAWLSDDLEAHTGISHALVAALRRVLHHDTLDDDAKAAICQLPSMDALDLGRHDVVKLWHGMAALEQGIGLALQSNWISTFESRQQQQTGGFDAPSSAMRALSAVALRYACAVEQDDQLAARAYAIGKTMTDRLAAMSCVRCDAMNSAVFADFLDRFGSVPRCLDKWFGLLARSPYPVLPGKVIARLEQLTARPDFDLLNPNRVYAVVRGFAEGNLLHFHAEDGSGYRFLEQKVRAVAAHNPQLAARLATSFGRQHLLLDAQRATLLGVVQQLRDDPSLVGHAEVMDILGRIS